MRTTGTFLSFAFLSVHPLSLWCSLFSEHKMTAECGGGRQQVRAKGCLSGRWNLYHEILIKKVVLAGELWSLGKTKGKSKSGWVDKNSVSRRAGVPWARRSLQCGGAINNAVDQQAANLHRSDFSDNNPPLFTNYKHSTCEKRTEEYWRQIKTKENNSWMDHFPICSVSPVHQIQVISQL